jgi:hypothetical protein
MISVPSVSGKPSPCKLIVSGWKGKQGVRVMVFNATFNNILVVSWWSVLLMEETGVP